MQLHLHHRSWDRLFLAAPEKRRLDRKDGGRDNATNTADKGGDGQQASDKRIVGPHAKRRGQVNGAGGKPRSKLRQFRRGIGTVAQSDEQVDLIQGSTVAGKVTLKKQSIVLMLIASLVCGSLVSYGCRSARDYASWLISSACWAALMRFEQMKADMSLLQPASERDKV